MTLPREVGIRGGDNERTNDVIKISSHLRLQVCVCGAVPFPYLEGASLQSNRGGVVSGHRRGQSTYKYSPRLVTSPGRIAAKL